MKSLLQKQEEVVAQFSQLTDWEIRYQKIIAMGKAIPELSDELRTEEAKVRGCQSQVWLHANLNDQGRMILRGDSDALIVKGLLAVLIAVYSDSLPEEVLQSPPHFLKDIGFEGNLSPNRANGLHAMIKQIQMFAMAFAYLKTSKQSPQ